MPIGVYKRKSSIEKFNEKYTVNSDTKCWEWTACISTTGYGKITIKYKTFYAHRLSYEFFIGEIPDGYFVCHKCDNPKCVNPFHLFSGTCEDNVHDAMNKGLIFGYPHPSYNHYKRGCKCLGCAEKYREYRDYNKERINSNAIKNRILREQRK